MKHSWRQRHSTMTPLFVDTQSSQLSVDSSPSEQSMSSAQVRATQDVQQFTATQDMGKLCICCHVHCLNFVKVFIVVLWSVFCTF